MPFHDNIDGNLTYAETMKAMGITCDDCIHKITEENKILTRITIIKPCNECKNYSLWQPESIMTKLLNQIKQENDNKRRDKIWNDLGNTLHELHEEETEF